MPVITLPDGSQRSFENPVSVHDVAADIGPGLAKAALAGVVDERQVDTSFVIDTDADLAIITDRDEAGIEIIRHSTAHLMAMATQQLFPGVQVTIGPVIEDGFFYDFATGNTFSPEDLEKIEAKMAEMQEQNAQIAALKAENKRAETDAAQSKEKIAMLASEASAADGGQVGGAAPLVSRAQGRGAEGGLLAANQGRYEHHPVFVRIPCHVIAGGERVRLAIKLPVDDGAQMIAGEQFMRRPVVGLQRGVWFRRIAAVIQPALRW